MKIINNNVSISDIAEIMDHTSSGYFDIGTMRMQWGISSASTITLPVSFANTSYVVTANMSNSSGAFVQTAVSYNKNTTYFSLFKYICDPNNIVETTASVNWMAIGLKP